MTLTQTKLVKAHLERGGTLTGLQALREFGIMHLPRRILDLKEGGMEIADRWVRVQKANGDNARVKEWRKG